MYDVWVFSMSLLLSSCELFSMLSEEKSTMWMRIRNTSIGRSANQKVNIFKDFTFKIHKWQLNLLQNLLNLLLDIYMLGAIGMSTIVTYFTKFGDSCKYFLSGVAGVDLAHVLLTYQSVLKLDSRTTVASTGASCTHALAWWGSSSEIWLTFSWHFHYSCLS